jgi:C4-dicarboxylate-specific signal transduction histidine kinase
MSTTEPPRDLAAPYRPWAEAASSGRPAIAGILAVAIFLIDTFARLDIAIAVLYSAVVLLSINFRSRHGVIITAAVCASLTILSFLVSHAPSFTYDAAGHCLISLAAIGITSFLASRIRFDITQRQLAEAIIEQKQQALQQAQAELAHIARVTTLGELTASIAHEVNQPLAAIVTNGEACLRFLNRDVPDLNEIRGCATRMISDGHRATEVIERLRALSKKTDLQKARLDINDVIDDAIPLVRREMFDHRVALRLDLAPGLAPLMGDRIQLQQVILNLVANGIDAMAPVTDRPRELLIRSGPHEQGQVLVAVQDTGIGIPPENVDRLFHAFFTTKPTGLGMGYLPFDHRSA